MHDANQKAPHTRLGRVLCVTSNFPRWDGDSTTPFVLHLAEDLQELGWQVDVLAPHAEKGTSSSERINGVQVERFHYLWPRRAQTVCYHGGALVNLRQNKVNWLKLPPLVTAEWAAVFQRLASHRYDLLHTHWTLPQGFTGVLAAKPLRIPHVLTVHGGDVFDLQGALLRSFKGFSLRHANAVTVNSSATLSATDKIAPGTGNLHRIPMGVDVRADHRNDSRTLEIRQRFRKGAGPLLVFVGRVIEEKGVEDFLQTLRLLGATHPESSGLIVGDGQHRRYFEEMAQSLDIGERVTFTGWVQPEDVPAYLAAADVFVGPSRTAKGGWIEAQGLTFIEAMIARTPVIATRTGGIVDSVKDGITGILVDQREPAQIAQAICKLAEDTDLAARLVDTAFAFANENFSRAASAKAFSALFTRVSARRTEVTA
jgi:glycosyltransferase involved in cell wall biosynthesis